MSTANKLLYLGETKSILKDTINMSNANITNSTTFRNYATQLKEGYIDILNNGTDTLYDNFTHLTGKGMTLSFAPTYQAPMKITCYGSTSQASTPTPSSPVDVVNTTGNQTISVNDGTNTDTYNIGLTSKNLFNKNNVTYGKRLTSAGVEYNDANYFLSNFIKVSSSTNYVKNSPTADAYHRFAFYSSASENDFISASNDNSITTPSTCIYLRFCGLLSEIDITQLEKGSSSTNYVDYFTPIELCKIGDYEDKIFKATNEEGLVSGKWYLKKNIGKVVLDGSENNLYQSNTANGRRNYIAIDNILMPTSGNTTPLMFSNYFTPTNPNKTWTDDISAISINTSNNYLLIKTVSTMELDTVDKFKTWLSTHNTTVYYILATPTYTKITGTLANQLENVYQKLLSYDNTTNISQINNDLAFQLGVQAIEKL